MRRWLALAFLLASVACASGQLSTYDGIEPEDVIQIPIVQIVNKNYYDADVWITNGRKIASSVLGSTGNVLVTLYPSDISPDGQVRFTVALKRSGKADMLPIVYRPGRKMRLDINSLFSTSQAW